MGSSWRISTRIYNTSTKLISFAFRENTSNSLPIRNVCTSRVSYIGYNVKFNPSPRPNLFSNKEKLWIARSFLTSTKLNYSSNSNDDPNSKGRDRRIQSTLYYLSALGVLVVGLSYAAVPLYRIFCQSYSYGGTTSRADDKDLSEISKNKNRPITIQFNADRSASLQWNFRPQQAEIIVYPGETALAFYQAENKTPFPIDGISTYNVIPFEAGQYFNKIQCFCFEEQRLNPGETVELPVFFYIDPEFSDDPKMQYIDSILLSYTFFESKEMPNLNIAATWAGHGGKSRTDSSSAS